MTPRKPRFRLYEDLTCNSLLLPPMPSISSQPRNGTYHQQYQSASVPFGGDDSTNSSYVDLVESSQRSTTKRAPILSPFTYLRERRKSNNELKASRSMENLNSARSSTSSPRPPVPQLPPQNKPVAPWEPQQREYMRNGARFVLLHRDTSH